MEKKSIKCEKNKILSEKPHSAPIDENTTSPITKNKNVELGNSKQNSHETAPIIDQNPIIQEQPNNENVVNIDEIPIMSKKKTFEELLQEELKRNNGESELPKDSRMSLAHVKKKEMKKIEKKYISESIETDEVDLGHEDLSEERKITKHQFLKRNTGKVSTQGKVKNKTVKKYSYYKDHFDSKPTQAEKEKPEIKKHPKLKEPERKITPKSLQRKFLVRGAGRGGGKGNLLSKDEASEKGKSERSIRVPEKAIIKINEAKNKSMSPRQPKSDEIEQEIDDKINE
jgi:hypothetical protein